MQVPWMLMSPGNAGVEEAGVKAEADAAGVRKHRQPACLFPPLSRGRNGRRRWSQVDVDVDAVDVDGAGVDAEVGEAGGDVEAEVERELETDEAGKKPKRREPRWKRE